MATANLGPDGPSSRGHTTAQRARRRAESSARTRAMKVAASARQAPSSFWRMLETSF